MTPTIHRQRPVIPKTVALALSCCFASAASADTSATTDPDQGNGDAVIVFRSTKPGTVIGVVNGHSFASASGVGGTATASGLAWTNLCEGPCRYRMTPGYYELHIGEGLVESTKGFTLHAGENPIVGDRGSPGLVIGGALLISFAAIGGGLLAGFSSVPAGIAVGGAGVVGGGLMMWSGWPSLEVDRDPSVARPTGVAYGGRF